MTGKKNKNGVTEIKGELKVDLVIDPKKARKLLADERMGRTHLPEKLKELLKRVIKDNIKLERFRFPGEAKYNWMTKNLGKKGKDA